MKSLLILMLGALFLAGCATTSDYQHYTDAQIVIQTAKANAEAEKYKAMAAIAVSGDTTARALVAMGLAMGNVNGDKGALMAQPKSGWDIGRDYLSIFVPAIVQGYGIHANMRTAIEQSNNSTEATISTNGTFLGMAGKIQSPQPNQTINGNGVVGAGTFNSVGGTGAAGGDYTAPVDSHDTTNSYNPAPVDNSNQGNPVTTYPASP